MIILIRTEIESVSIVWMKKQQINPECLATKWLYCSIWSTLVKHITGGHQRNYMAHRADGRDDSVQSKQVHVTDHPGQGQHGRNVAGPRKYKLTHWGRGKMAAIFQTAYSNAFSLIKCINFDWYFTEVCSQGSSSQYSSIGSDNGLAPARRQAIIWTNDGLFTDAYMRHSASMS